MRYNLTIDCTRLEQPCLNEVANILQTQAETLLRCSGQPAQELKLCNLQGQAVGKAKFVVPTPKEQRIPDCSCEWEAGLSVPVACEFDWDRAGHEHGKDGVKLYAAYVNGVDLYPMLTESQIAEAEDALMSGLPDDFDDNFD